MTKLFTNKAYTSIEPWHALAALVILNITIALCIGNKLGEGWDETFYYLYGEKSLDAYISGLHGLALIPSRHIFFSDLRYYGPFYAVTGKVTADALAFVLRNWSYEDIWHLVNFVYFQGALISLYIVAKRFMRPWAAFGTVLLFATQPLIFGHAFINPKDIPFMTFFLASVAFGLMMLDGIKNKPGADISINDPSSTGSRHSLAVAVLFGLLVLTVVGKDVIASFIGSLVSFFYYSSPTSIWGGMFSLIADQADQLPVESYIHKAVNAKIERTAIILALFFVMAKPYMDEFKRKQKTGNPLIFDHEFDPCFIGKVLIAGVFLGLTTSIRLIGPFAGLLIILQLLMTAGKKSIPTMIHYFSIAALTTYLTWPFLWDSPSYRFFESFEVMKNFPFAGLVKFMGNYYEPGNLPSAYIPTLMTFQLTEPLIILFIIGFVITVYGYIKKTSGDKTILMIHAWFIIPLGLFIILRSSGYDNFRQFFFVLPPILILSGIAFDKILKSINHKLAGSILTAAIMLPGILSILSLHPYEYIYYNRFAGGLSKASENFETDYWLTSYREAAVYLNENAPKGSRILVWGAIYNVEHNAREDLQVQGFSVEDRILEGYDYALISTRLDMNRIIFPNAITVFEVRKNGVLLAVVKKLTP